MTNGVKNVPELRFPEFDGGWEEKQLSTILEIGTGKSKVQSNESGKYNILGSTGIIGKSHTYDYEGDFILTARVGHYAGKLYKHAGKVNISDNTIYLFNFINKNFIYESLNVFKLEKLVFGSGQPLIKASDLKKLKIRVPVSKEQKKIGVFFSKLDRQIKLEEQKLSLLEEQKKGYMQQIFSQELRFKDKNGNDYPEWEEINLGSLYKTGKAGGTPKSTESKYYNGKVPFLSISDITKQGKFLNTTEKKITQEGLDNSTAWLVPVNSINYAMYASVGYLSINKIEVATSQAIFNMVFEDYNLVEYLYYYLNYIRDKGVLEKLMGTGTQSNLSASIMKNITVKLPSKNEIIKTSKFLGNVDGLIETQSSKVELLKERKKGFLQKMFV